MIAEVTGLDLHWGMWLPTIMGQGTGDQFDMFGMPSLEYGVIGTYAQTELGHGTFLRCVPALSRCPPGALWCSRLFCCAQGP